MKIANIVSEQEINLPNYFNVVNSMDEINHELPTLIIGYYLTERLYPNFDISESKINEDVYWTLKKVEKRDKYEEDLRNFTVHVCLKLVEDITYLFVDPILLNKKSLYKIIKKIKDSEDIITVKNNDMVYMLSDKIIFGVDLKLIKYLGFNIDKLIYKIKSLSNVFLLSDDILIEYKDIIEILNNKILFLPYLYSIRNGEKNINNSIIHIS
jgi:hypothetical protein